jgi:hypothetical protein
MDKRLIEANIAQTLHTIYKQKLNKSRQEGQQDARDFLPMQRGCDRGLL